MTVNEGIPDYDLEDMVVVTAPGQLRALADPLRGTILELLLERAATVTELARAVGRELGQLFLYPGDRHLFEDSSLPSYDPDAAAQVLRHSREFLDQLG